ncbi:unnamed protein product [Closterium sp. NIES-64]|nr:unnamed protein product [Closterium sp. NIES-64]
MLLVVPPSAHFCSARPISWLDNNNIEGPLPASLCSLPWLWRIMLSNNYLYGPLPDCLFDKCVNQIDVSNNSLYGRINRDFKNMVADGTALINLAHNFFFGDAVLFAAGCKVCPVDITEPNILDMADTSSGQGAGKCIIGITSMKDYSVAGAGKGARVSLSGNCLMLSPDADCPSNATQRSTAACQAFCSITDNSPCDGHGELSSLSTGAIVGIAVGCFAGSTLLAAVVAWLLWPRGPKKWEGLDVCEQFSIQQMVKATNNWSDDNVRAMASLHHSHLVRLLGFCLDHNVETGKQEQILVYEFVGNRDLEYHIYKSKSPLSLRQRLRLAQGAAEGLAYLHGFETPIVHRDIKPANILVTADFQAKVADFGLLKLITHGDADATRVAGTPGYVDPDYARTNIITAKSDARKKMETFQLDDLKDSRMLEVSREAVVDIADLALDCMKSPGTRRPSMIEVAYRLNALIEKHCPDKEKEDDSGSLGEEESASSGGFSSKNVSSMLFGVGGRDSQRSTLLSNPGTSALSEKGFLPADVAGLLSSAIAPGFSTLKYPFLADICAAQASFENSQKRLLRLLKDFPTLKHTLSRWHLCCSRLRPSAAAQVGDASKRQRQRQKQNRQQRGLARLLSSTALASWAVSSPPQLSPPGRGESCGGNQSTLCVSPPQAPLGVSGRAAFLSARATRCEWEGGNLAPAGAAPTAAVTLWLWRSVLWRSVPEPLQ